MAIHAKAMEVFRTERAEIPELVTRAALKNTCST